MELKVTCDCGQRFKFDVEPVHGRMPFPVNCPACGADGTQNANGLLAQMPPSTVNALMPASVPAAAMAEAAPAPVAVMAAPDMAAPTPAGLRINRPVVPPPVAPPIPAAAVAMATTVTRAPALPKYMQTNPATQYNNFALGILGAIIGAGVDIGLITVLTMFMGRLLLFGILGGVVIGIIEGAIIGFGARLLYRGTSTTLGAVSAAVALCTIALTFLLFGNIITILLSGVMSLLVGVSTAFKVAS